MSQLIHLPAGVLGVTKPPPRHAHPPVMGFAIPGKRLNESELPCLLGTSTSNPLPLKDSLPDTIPLSLHQTWFLMIHQRLNVKEKSSEPAL